MIRQTIDVRLIGHKPDLENFISSMVEWMKRDGYTLAKQPTYKLSRKDPEDAIAYTEWLKNTNE